MARSSAVALLGYARVRPERVIELMKVRIDSARGESVGAVIGTGATTTTGGCGTVGWIGRDVDRGTGRKVGVGTTGGRTGWDAGGDVGDDVVGAVIGIVVVVFRVAVAVAVAEAVGMLVDESSGLVFTVEEPSQYPEAQRPATNANVIINNTTTATTAITIHRHFVVGIVDACDSATGGC